MTLNVATCLDNIKESHGREASEVEALEHRRRAAEEEFEAYERDHYYSEVGIRRSDSKRWEGTAKMRATVDRKRPVDGQREMNTNIEYEQLTLRANALRENSIQE